MSATPTESPPAAPNPATPPAPAQEPTDWKAEARKWEGRAKENENAAKKLESLEEASKSELQKAIDRATKAESAAATLPAKISETLKTHLVALGVVAKEDEVLLTASDPDSLLAQIKRLSERSDTRRKGGNVVPREGQPNKQTKVNELGDFARDIFGRKE